MIITENGQNGQRFKMDKLCLLFDNKTNADFW